MAAAMNESAGDILSRISRDFDASPEFQELRHSFLATGRGRRKEVSRSLDNKLLLQVFLLKKEGGKSWPDVEAFIQKVGKIDVPKDRLRTLTEKAVREVDKQTLQTLDTFLCRKVDLGGIGERLTAAGFTTASLFDSTFDVRESMPSNGLLIELGRVQQKHNLSNETFLQWFCRLTGVSTALPPGTAAKFRKWVNGLVTQLKKLQGNKGKKDGAAALEKFLDDPFVIPGMFKDCEPERCNNTPSPTQNLGGMHSQLSMLRRQIEEKEQECQSLKQKVDVLTKERQTTLKELKVTTDTNVSLVRQVVEEKKTSSVLKRNCEALRAELKIKTTQLSTLKKENVARRLRKMEILNTNLISRLQRLQKSERTTKRAHNKRQYVQTQLAVTKRKSRDEKQEKVRLNKENHELRQHVTELEAKVEERVVRLKDPDTGYFTDAAKVCMMSLSGEHEIAAERCGRVIETVCRTVLDARVPESDLPSARSVGRSVDAGQVLSKMHVAEALSNSDRFDLHTDGTTKLGKKVVTQQVTTNVGQTFSCGFSVVASESADTLLDVATSFLEELTIVYKTDEEKHEKFLEFLQKLSGLMSDRAAVMKCFNSRFNDLRSEILLTEGRGDVAFLYCNAHFLLGLSSCVGKVFKDLSDADGRRIGRETVDKFLRGAKREHPAIRYIREACSCLGPRGDERFGCRENWLAYCLMNNVDCSITSFKANRFNNLFQAAASIHHHQHDIKSFFTDLSDLNWKQEGILHDSSCTDIDNYLIALGLLFYRLTGPYWLLLGKDGHYLDFYLHVVQMKDFLQRWEMDPHDAFHADFDGLFGVDMGYDDAIFRSLLTVPVEQQDAVRVLLQALCRRFLKVVQDQLKDFLPGGKYHDVQDPEMWEKLQHSKLTNMVSEMAFGDLDYSVFKRRNASAHLHSSINMMKRNKTMTDWFCALPPEEQKAALQKASALREKLRKKKRNEEKAALVKRKELLQATKAKKEALQEKQRLKKLQIIEQLRKHHGPCTSAADVRRILRTLRSVALRKKAVQAEIQYQKLILGHKSPLLVISKKLPQLISNLCEFLGGAMSDNESDAEPEQERRPPPKRRRLLDQVDDTEDEDAEENDEVDDEVPVPLPDFHFKFERAGGFVAVGYEDGFYVGEVEEVVQEDRGVINFMTQCGTVFKWPNTADRATVEAKFVLAADLPLTTTTGRLWKISPESLKCLKGQFTAFKLLYFVA